MTNLIFFCSFFYLFIFLSFKIVKLIEKIKLSCFNLVIYNNKKIKIILWIKNQKIIKLILFYLLKLN